jgi:hypothetical protein
MHHLLAPVYLVDNVHEPAKRLVHSPVLLAPELSENLIFVPCLLPFGRA